jgi:ribosomal protein L40E
VREVADVRFASAIGLVVVARQSFNPRSSLISLNRRSGDYVIAKKEAVHMDEDKSCEACGAPLPLNAQFCIQCGAAAVEAEVKANGGAAALASTAPFVIDGVLVVSANWIRLTNC